MAKAARRAGRGNIEKRQNLSDALSDQDLKLWQSVSQSVTPLTDRNQIEPDLPKYKPKSTAMSVSQHGSGSGDLDTGNISQPEGIEPGMYRKLARGQLPFDQRVDLHGMNQRQAYVRVKSALMHAFAQGQRAIIVVTGKGGARYLQKGDVPAAHRTRADFDIDRGGVLRQALPNWLSEPVFRPYIAGFAKAHANHGGSGACYILIRRRKKIR